MEYSVALADAPTPEELSCIGKQLRDYNIEAIGPMSFTPIAIFVRNEAGEIVGGLKGLSYLGWMFVEWLALEKAARGKGIGSQVLQAAETEARRRGCHGIYLDTFSFQAREFYEKNGFEVFGKLDDFPGGHQRYFLQKRLT